MPKFSKNAFNCYKCPKQGGENGCPAWWTLNESNLEGETRVLEVCGFEYLPMFLQHIHSASLNSAESSNQARNAMQEIKRLAMQKVTLIDNSSS